MSGGAKRNGDIDVEILQPLFGGRYEYMRRGERFTFSFRRRSE